MKPDVCVANDRLRTASCSCGAVELELHGEPRSVYACACNECQRCTGTAFAYRAIYSDTAIAGRKGNTRAWRRNGTSGRWLEQHFCGDCGSIIFMSAEALTGAISVSVGCFGEAEFPPPKMLHWPERRHHWLCLEAIAQAAPVSA